MAVTVQWMGGFHTVQSNTERLCKTVDLQHGGKRNVTAPPPLAMSWQHQITNCCQCAGPGASFIKLIKGTYMKYRGGGGSLSSDAFRRGTDGRLLVTLTRYKAANGWCADLILHTPFKKNNVTFWSHIRSWRTNYQCNNDQLNQNQPIEGWIQNHSKNQGKECKSQADPTSVNLSPQLIMWLSSVTTSGHAPNESVDGGRGDLLPDLNQGITDLMDSLWWYSEVSDALITSKRCSVGFRSGEWEGQSVASVPSSRNCLHTKHCPAPGETQGPLYQCKVWHSLWGFTPVTNNSQGTAGYDMEVKVFDTWCMWSCVINC